MRPRHESPSSKKSFILGLVGWLALGAAVWADGLSANVGEPYTMTVCLRFSDDPVFTRFYTHSVRRQVHDQLADYFGSLVELEVVSEHPFGESIGEAGLAGLTVEPEQFDRVPIAEKLFLGTIDFEAGQYRLAWRQIDGEMQRVGPLRGRATPDRQWLAKAVCLAVRDDFAPVAVVEPAGTDAARLEFRGAGRGTRLASLLAEGCVLQPYWVIRRQGGALSRTPIPYTLLRIEPGADATRAAVVSSLPDPWKRTARVAGFQAIKLNTRSGRFRLRLVDAESGAPVQNCQVYANSRGFDHLGDADRLDPPDRHGWVIAPKPFSDLAYVEIVQSGGAVSRLLLPITDAWCEEVCKLRVEEKAADKGDWQRDAAVLVQDVQVLQGMLDQYVRQLNLHNERKQYEQALEHVRIAVRTLDPLRETIRRDAADLRARAGTLDLDSDQRLAWIAERVGEVDVRVEELGAMEAKLEETIRKVESGNLAAVQAQLAEDLVRQGDVEGAIANYREAVRLSPESGFARRLQELESTWQIKDEGHRVARAFVFETWADARITQFEKRLPEAQEAFKKLVEVDDHLTARRLLKSTDEHLRELSDLVDMLLPRTGEADREDREKYIALADEMARFQLEVSAYLKRRLEPSSAAESPRRGDPPTRPAPMIEEEEEEEDVAP